MKLFLLILFSVTLYNCKSQALSDSTLQKIPTIEKVFLGMTTYQYDSLKLDGFDVETKSQVWYFEIKPTFYYGFLSQFKMNLKDYLFSVSPSEITDLYTLKYGKPLNYSKKDSVKIINHPHYGKNYKLTTTFIQAAWKFSYYDIIIDFKSNDYYGDVLEGNYEIVYKCNDDYYKIIDTIKKRIENSIMEKSKKRI